MPYSSYDNLSTVMGLIVGIQPKSILDVGIGWGAFGFLSRRHLDLANPQTSDRENWRTKIVGVEIFEGYRNPVWDFAYDKVIIGDAAKLAPTLGAFDVVLLIDCIEHMDKAVGLALLEALLSNSRFVILSAPHGFTPQGASYGNPAERHVAAWSRDDLAPYHAVYRDCSGCFVALLSKDPIPRECAAHVPGAWVSVKRDVIGGMPLWAWRLYRRLKFWAR